MIYICPSCGVRLEKEFKFCPNCGFDLSSSAVEEESINTSKGNMKKEKVPVKAPVKQQPEGARNLSGRMIASIIVISVGLVLVILMASGVFESAPAPVVMSTPPVQQQNQTQQPQSGVDLNLVPEINSLEAKVKANPNDLESLLQLAHLKNDARMFPQAIDSYREYLSKNPANTDARVDMGVCYFQLQDYSTAIAEMETALKYEPKHQIAHLNLGIVNLTAGNLEKSKEWFRKAVEIDPNSDVGKRAQELLTSHGN